MSTKVKELPKIMDLESGSSTRREDRIYEDQVNQYMKYHPGMPVRKDEKTVYGNVLVCAHEHKH